jgi:hypothetical protein
MISTLGFEHADVKTIRLLLDEFETRWVKNNAEQAYIDDLLGILLLKTAAIGIVTNNGKSCLDKHGFAKLRCNDCTHKSLSFFVILITSLFFY